MRISVLVPTYRRPAELRRCLEALGAQTRRPDEVIVVVRDTDLETRVVLRECAATLPELRVVQTCRAGVAAAYNAGLDAATGDVLAITDDDAAPRRDWLQRIEAHYAHDTRIGGAGGRDWVHHGESVEDGSRRTVGRVRWFGRVVGNHHLGAGPARQVHVLKGANMSFRRAAIVGLRFDERLRGAGAQVHVELAFCLAVRRAGWRLIYDPAVAVDHFPAQRFDADQRGLQTLPALADAVFNELYALLRWLPLAQKPVALAYHLGIGSRAAPGLLLAAAGLAGRAPARDTLSRSAAATRARIEAAAVCLIRSRDQSRPPCRSA